jgi:hypothetical protein
MVRSLSSSGTDSGSHSPNNIALLPAASKDCPPGQGAIKDLNVHIEVARRRIWIAIDLPARTAKPISVLCPCLWSPTAVSPRRKLRTSPSIGPQIFGNSDHVVDATTAGALARPGSAFEGVVKKAQMATSPPYPRAIVTA